MRNPRTSQPLAPQDPAGGHLVASDGRTLPLTAASLSGDARGGLIRVVLEQTFANPFDEPLQVTYSLPLPADAAVSGFAFRFGGERVVGEVDLKARARERFEAAVLDGKTAALLEEERTSLFTQAVGNIPPRTEVVCEVHLDQPLQFLPQGAWEWRFPTVVAPRYLGAAGRLPDARAVQVPVSEAPPPVAMQLRLEVRDELREGARPESPAHALHTERLPGRVAVAFADARGAQLDRDVVVRWQVAQLTPGLQLEVVERQGRTFGLVTLVPPAPEARLAALPRDLVVLLDTSGSMGGSPLGQARRLTSALVDSLTDQDQLELIEFSVAPRRWKKGPVPATAAHRAEAQAWLARLRASGGTEMREGILEALAPLREGAQRQVVLITDGLIGFEGEVVTAVTTRLPPGSRVHTVGVGSGVNRSLTQPVARAGRGLELLLGLDEDVEPAVRRLLERTVAPLLTGLELTGPGVRAVAPTRLPDVHAGAPALFSVELEPGTTSLTLEAAGAGGRFQRTASASGPGRAAVAALFGREQVEDLELSRAAGADPGEVDASIEQLGLEFQLSTRLTSWVAVSRSATVDPRAPGRRVVQPQALPYGMSAEGLGLRGASGAELSVNFRGSPSELFEEESLAEPPAAPAGRQRAPKRAKAAPKGEARPASPPSTRGLGRLFQRADTADDAAPAPAAVKAQEEREPAMETRSRLGGAGTPAPRILAARAIRLPGGELVLEVTVEGVPLTWAPAPTLEVELEDGRWVVVRVKAERTTAPGTYAAGLVVRLALEGAPAEGVRAALLEGDGEPLRLELR